MDVVNSYVVRIQQVTSITTNMSAHQVFDQMYHLKERLETKKKLKGLKSWMFKYNFEKRILEKRHNRGWLHTWSRRVTCRKIKSAKLEVTSELKEANSLWDNREVFGFVQEEMQTACKLRRIYCKVVTIHQIFQAPLEMAIPPTKGHKQVLEQLCDTLGEVDRVALQSDIGANVSKSKKHCESVTWIQDHRVEEINKQAVAYGEAVMISLNETDVLQSSWEHQMFSHRPTRLLSRRKQRKCFKSWRFKFKQVKEGNKQQHNLFRQMGTITILWWWLQNGSKVQWHILIVKRVSEIFGELKRVQASNAIIYVLSYGNHHYKLSWHFKLIYWQFLYSFKTELYEEAVTGTEHFQHHEQDKFLTTWLLKFDKSCVQGELIAYEGEIVGFYTTIGDRDIYFSVWHCWRKKKLHIINLQQLATVLHSYEKPKLGDFSQSYLLVINKNKLFLKMKEKGIELGLFTKIHRP
ncbi:hypothetical protein AtNW77_Chr2g0232191 [Arabidopsis thaliana]|uniref:Uncharacterized protein n=1 Tax=Arabidopsis thaliana TaxID=3702 RepID=A0A654EUH2_ARATH|nr:unnamed protein product [Arabidopsis thaliana]